MKVRKLLLQDARYMWEWMQDESVVQYLNTNFEDMTIKDCEKFIVDSWENSRDLNLAIADDEDVYMGTVSLKHIDTEQRTAEFAITIRSIARGRGFSAYGMKEILRIGFEELSLKEIVWCVSRDNERARRFYDKNGYARREGIPEIYKNYYSKEQMESLLWYGVQREDM